MDIIINKKAELRPIGNIIEYAVQNPYSSSTEIHSGCNHVVTARITDHKLAIDDDSGCTVWVEVLETMSRKCKDCFIQNGYMPYLGYRGT